MTVNVLIQRDHLVGLLRGSLLDGESSLDHGPQLLAKVIREDAWRERQDWATRTTVRFDRFADFVTAPPTEGLGTTIDLVQRIIGDDVELRSTVDRLTQNPVGRPPNETRDNVTSSPGPTGNSEAKALRRLRDQRPDLHADVLAGKLRAHAAMIAAGFRRRTITVPIDKPENTAATLRRHLSPDYLAALGLTS